MTRIRFNLRNVAAGAACLAVCMMFSGCDKDPKDDPKNPDNPDGSGLNAWTKVTSPFTTPFYSIAYGNGKFVAGNTEGMVAISSDNGKTWTTKKISEGGGVNSIIYVNDKFVAVVGDRVCQAQNPEDDWTMMADLEIFDLNIIRVIYFDGTRYLIGASDGKMVYSTDLVNWTATKINVFASEYKSIYGFAYGNGKLVATGEDGAVAYASSPDGEWTLIPNDLGTAFIRAAIYVNNTFVAVGSAVGTSATIIYTDNPASMWTKAANNAASAFNAIVYGGGYYVAGGSRGGIAYAKNLDTWTKVSDSKFGSNEAINGVAFGNNTFVAVGGDGSANKSSVIAYTTIK